jgi:hypothetical protein
MQTALRLLTSGAITKFPDNRPPCSLIVRRPRLEVPEDWLRVGSLRSTVAPIINMIVRSGVSGTIHDHIAARKGMIREQ